MTPANQGSAAPARPPVFDIKSTQLDVLSLVLRQPENETTGPSDASLNTDNAALLNNILSTLAARFGADGESPGFFDHDGVVIDVSALPGGLNQHDLASLITALQRHSLLPVAVRGGDAAMATAAHACALMHEPEVRAPAPRTQDAVQQAREAAQPEDHAAPVTQEEPDLVSTTERVPGPSADAAQATAEAAARPVSIPAGVPTLVIDKPLRSGQKAYARGGDLVVLAMVNAGAEVVADGNIHVYAPLRGRAIAGARGNTQARIFSLAMEPELISIAGVYRTSENPLAPDVHGKAAQIRLGGEALDKLIFEPLNT